MSQNIFPSARLLSAFHDYEKFHQTPGNKTTHFIGIPLVLLSLLGLLAHVPLTSHLDLGIVLFAWGAGYAFRADAKLAVPFSLFCLLNYFLARHINLPILTGLQALGWIFQLWGHYRYEKKSPAFFTTLSHLFVGPLWIFAWTIGYYRPSVNAKPSISA